MRYAMIMLLVSGLFTFGCDSGGGCGTNCDDDSGGGSQDAPAGAVEIEPGTSWASVQAAIEGDPVLRDLGSMGARFEYPTLGVAGMLSGIGDDATVITVERAAAVGVAAGDPRKSVASALGDPVEDLFIDGWWYPEAGLMVEFEDGVVARIHAFAAAQ